jgi:hypothetical protein
MLELYYMAKYNCVLKGMDQGITRLHRDLDVIEAINAAYAASGLGKAKP